MIIPRENISTHPCLEGYSKYYTDNSTFYFYPMTGKYNITLIMPEDFANCLYTMLIPDDGQIIKKSLIENEELTVLETPDAIKENLPGKKCKYCFYWKIRCNERIIIFAGNVQHLKRKLPTTSHSQEQKIK